jgi:NADP-dependent 3-hydroxy acid dehydrogenase YdfG
MNLQLEGKLALVNGSTAGIGSAIDKALAAEDVRVTVNGRNDVSLPFSATVMKRASKNLMKLSSNSKNK